MRKRILALLLAVLALFSLAGCASRAEEPAPEQGVDLNVVTSYGRGDGNRKSFEAAVASFEAKTGHHVIDGSSISSEEWKNKVLTDFMTGSEPDVLFYFTDVDAEPFINAGRVVSIEEIREEYPDYATNMKQAMMAVASDGKHYAVPSTGYWEDLFVNRRVLAACGLSLPGPDYSWEQFLADCEVIRQAGYTPIACSLFEIPHYWFEFAVLNNGTLAGHLDVPHLDGAGRLVRDAAAESWIGGIEDIKSLYDAGYLPEDTLTATDAETVALFAEGEAAFLIDGSWKVGYLTEYYPEHLEDFVVSFVPGKGERKATEAIGGISMGYFITRKAWDEPRKREAAVSFVFHMTSEEVLSSFITTEVTALIDGASPTGLNAIQRSAAETNAQITGIVGAVQDCISGEAKAELFTDIQRCVTGQMSAEEAVEAAIRLNEEP
ncbi:MAG: carbohydrate ABC transporter substrate-binding protein [Oscillospiraceae bacterium]|nr:carbohydrate ABC transporter substrate-binding protein [Oscillospiraceae bacterium]